MSETKIKKGGCGLCPYDKDTCYHIRKEGFCFYDGLFTEIVFDECPHRLAPTNYDRIRVMSVEELARWIADELIEPGYYDGDQCYELWLDWLKQEADDGKHP